MNKPSQHYSTNLNDICQKAIQTGFIGLYDLGFVLGNDAQYDDRLPEYWQKYQLNLWVDYDHKWDFDNSTENQEGDRSHRIGAWVNILHRFAHGEIPGGRSNRLEKLTYIRLHSFNSDLGKFEIRDSYEFDAGDFGPEFVKLSDLKNYFNDLSIPLPAILYQDQYRFKSDVYNSHLRDYSESLKARVLDSTQPLELEEIFKELKSQTKIHDEDKMLLIHEIGFRERIHGLIDNTDSYSQDEANKRKKLRALLDASEHGIYSKHEMGYADEENNFFSGNYKPASERETKQRKLTPDQQAKIECRRIADELWKKDLKITIADMAFCNEIETACNDTAGKTYSENTIRKWIKDLCPNRNPGRRPKKQ